MDRKIIVVGSINMDMLVRADRLPSKGETVIGKSISFMPGGKGLNQAVSASRLGGNVSFVCKIGKDEFGSMLLKFLKEEKFNTGNVKISNTSASGAAVIKIDNNGQNMITVVPGSNYELSESEIDLLKINPTDIVISQFEIPNNTIKRLFEKARKAHATTILNPSPLSNPDKEVIDLADYLVLNEVEASILSSQKASSKINDILRQATSIKKKNQSVIVTIGKEGALCVTDEKIYVAKGVAVKAIDTTGAGDCFLGAFATALAEGMNMQRALEFANCAAAISVQRHGATASFPRRKEVAGY